MLSTAIETPAIETPAIETPAIETPAIETPCIKVCVIHPVQKLCLGCGRTLDEIASWIDLDAAERRRIMALLPLRLDAMTAAAQATKAAQTAKA